LQKIAGARKASRAGAIFGAVLLAGVPGLSVTAQAMLAPVASEAVPAPPPLADITSIATGPTGALLEHDYFRLPPQPQAARRILPCTVHLLVFEKTRIAQSCY
jgi:hypothetical protein